MSHLGADERRALVLMIQAADIMDRQFWYGAYGDKPLGANFYPADMSREEF